MKRFGVSLIIKRAYILTGTAISLSGMQYAPRGHGIMHTLSFGQKKPTAIEMRVINWYVSYKNI